MASPEDLWNEAITRLGQSGIEVDQELGPLTESSNEDRAAVIDIFPEFEGIVLDPRLLTSVPRGWRLSSDAISVSLPTES